MKTEKKWSLISSIFVIGAFFAGWFIYTNLQKGFIFNDEAMYHFLFRDYEKSITIDSSNFFRIFHVFYTENVYHFRVITYFLLNFSTFLLFFSVSQYFTLKVNPFLIGFLGISFNFFTWYGSNIILQQYFGNSVLVNFSMAFLSFFLLYKKKILLLPSGFFIGILLFDGIPHTIAIVPIVLFLLINFWRNHKTVFLYFGLGIFLAITYYFTFIQDFSHFISQFEYIKIYKKFHTKQHPKSFYIYWVLRVIGYIAVPAIIIIFGILRFSKNKKKTLDIVLLVLASVTLFSYFLFPFVYLNYLFLAVLLYRFWLSDVSLEKKTFLSLIYLLPFCLSFGSGAYFDSRAAVYMIYFVLCLVTIIIIEYPVKYYFIFILFYLVCLAIFPNFLKDKGWKDYIITEQTEKVKVNGYDLYLDKFRKKDLDDLRPFLNHQPKVIYSSNHLMGYLYILNAEPPIHYYFTLKDYLKFIIEKKGTSPDDYIYLESDNYPFSKKEFLPLQFVKHPENYKKIKTGRFTLYLPANYQQK